MAKRRRKKKSGLVGRRIVDVYRMPDTVAKYLGWYTTLYRPAPVMLLLDDGTYLYASQDEEQNGPGCLYGVATDGMGFMVNAETEEEKDDGEAT